MARNSTTSAIIDGVLRCSVIVGSVSIAVILPNLLQALDKPTQKYLNSLDDRARKREVQRVINYALRRRLITEHYQHGIVLTNGGKRRLVKRNLDTLHIPKPAKWDHRWRIIMFDIPEKQRGSRVAFTRKIRELGLQPLQQSAWIHPFECRDEISLVGKANSVMKYVTYIETSHIDQENLLKKRFSSLLVK